MKPRRTGTIEEYQNGHYFMYVTEWDETDEHARKHREIEVYYAKARVVTSLETDPRWNSTDPQLFESALALFQQDPHEFEMRSQTGALAQPEPGEPKGQFITEIACTEEDICGDPDKDRAMAQEAEEKTDGT